MMAENQAGVVGIPWFEKQSELAQILIAKRQDHFYSCQRFVVVQPHGLITTSRAGPRNKMSNPFNTSRPTIRS